jgi:Kdo2-lipid IVA lauroyltransferase/acyltransferase
VNLTSLRHRAEYLAVRVLVCVLQTLRMETCAVLARRFARLATDLFRLRADVLAENLAIAYPHWTAAERRTCILRMWEHLFLFIAEVVQSPRKIRVTNYRRYVTFREEADFARVMYDDRPTIFLTAHFGAFEMLGYFAGMVGIPSYTIVRTLDNPLLETFLARFRGATGQHLIAKEGASDRIGEVLKQGHLLGILADQYAGSKGSWVTFFGKPASTHKAVALLALTEGARLIVATVRRDGRPMQYVETFHGEFDPRTATPEQLNPTAITQWFTTEFEQFIRAEPSQYWWLHRRWKDNRKTRAAKRGAAAAAAAAQGTERRRDGATEG